MTNETDWQQEGLTQDKIKLALQTLGHLVNQQKNNFLEESSTSPLYIVLSMYKIPKSVARKPITIKLPVPHSFREDNEILLITQDTKKVKLKGDWEKSITRYDDLLTKHNARNLVSQIMPLHQLRIEYKDYEAKRNLSNMFDFVLCDDTVINRVPLFLGKNFYTKKKKPVAVNLKAKNMKKELNKVIQRAYLNLDLTGNTAMVEVGNLGMKSNALEENIMAAVENIAKKIPGKKKNIQSLYVKTKTSKSVPLYLNLASRSTVPPVSHPNKPAENTFVMDELPTGSIVKVYRDGTVVKISRKKYEQLLKKQTEETET